MFSPVDTDLPVCSDGDIIRLHRVQIESFNGEYNGRLQLHSGGSWVLFDSWTDNFNMMGSSSQGRMAIFHAEVLCSFVKLLSQQNV